PRAAPPHGRAARGPRPRRGRGPPGGGAPTPVPRRWHRQTPPVGWEGRASRSGRADSRPPTIGATVAEQSRLDKVIALARHRGFVFQAGEIYGGSRSAWDYGPLGTELKENIRRQWWQTFVRGRGDMVGLDSSIILPSAVWEASGHVATFTDPLVECLSCHRRHREDHLI